MYYMMPRFHIYFVLSSFRKYSTNRRNRIMNLSIKENNKQLEQVVDQEIQIKFYCYTTTEIYLVKRALVETLESFSKRTGFA